MYMNKRLMVLLTAFMVSIVFGSVAEAHSSMVSSDPEDGSTAEGEVSDVTMTFDTDIQQEEEIYLENADGERVEPEAVNIDGDTVEVTFSEPLAAAEYNVVWELYGADGHLVNGDFGFTVAEGAADGSEEESEETAEEQTEEEQPEEQTDEVPAEESEGAVEDAAVEDGGGMSGGVIALIAGLAVVVIAMIIIFARKRK